MDPRIIDLKSTPCSGRRRTRPPIAEVRETVGRCSHCSRNELAKTLCEHLHWTTAKGGSRVGAGLGMLEALERRGIRTRPPPARRYRTMPEGERFAVRAAVRGVEASG